jgi:nitroreductase
MPEQPTDRLAQTSVPIHPPIAQRWSPRAFDPDAQITTDQIAALLEAARWAATWGRRQPVRFVVGIRRAGAQRPGDQSGADATFDTLAGLLSRGNAYAKAASALILVCADEGEDADTALYSAVDAGAAEANLLIEATSRGLIGHPMAGFDADGARVAFGIPDRVRPLMVIAVGSLADPATVAPEVAERDATPRSRAPLTEVAFTGAGGRPWR